jgi:cation:H+ antiporter
VSVLTFVLLAVGFVALIAGGEVLVRGAGGLARSLGLSPLVVGLTVVSFATSAPELAVTLDASLTGRPGLAVGNVVGSNIANVLLVLGFSALFLPLAVRSAVTRRDVPVMIALSALFLVLSLDGSVSQLDGVVLVLLLLAYVGYSVRAGRKQAAEDSSDEDDEAPDVEPDDAGADAKPPSRPWIDVLLVLGGVALLVVGSRSLVTSATDIASALGLSELIIGLTVVAIGTSLPELATSVVAALRGERELAVGNVVGSNIFNIGAVMGLVAAVSPGGVPVEPSAVNFDIPVMVAVMVALLPVAFTGYGIARWEGGLFVAYYGAYTLFLLLDATTHDALPEYSALMLTFVVPLTALSLLLLAVYELGVRRGRRQERRAQAGADRGT